jgi:hypothetical protein
MESIYCSLVYGIYGTWKCPSQKFCLLVDDGWHKPIPKIKIQDVNMIYLVIGNARARITDVMLKVRERVKKERGRIFVE